MAKQKEDVLTVQCKDGVYEMPMEYYDRSILVRDFLSAAIVKTWPKEQVEAEVEELLMK